MSFKPGDLVKLETGRSLVGIITEKIATTRGWSSVYDMAAYKIFVPTTGETIECGAWCLKKVSPQPVQVE
jgi:hypothetical protein